MIYKKIKDILHNKTAKQSIVLSTANILSLGIGFGIALILPKVLGAYDYGLFSLASVIISILSIFFELGIFVSVARLLVQIKEYKKQIEIIAISIRILGVIAIIFAIVVYIVSQIIDYFLIDKVGFLLATGSIFSISLMLPFVVEQLCSGSNQIYRLAFNNILGKLLYGIVILYLTYFNLLSVKNVLLAFLVSPIVGFIIVFFCYIKCSIKIKKEIINKIIEINKNFGLKNFYGRIIGTTASQLNRIIIGYFCGVSDVGLFSLAVSLTTPIYTCLQSIAISNFRDFSGFSVISKNFIYRYIVIIVCLSLGVFFVSYFLFNFYYNRQYNNGIIVVFFMIIAMIFQSMYVPYNTWLSVNGLGKEQYILAWVFGILGLSTNFILIPILGIKGACISLIIMNFYFFVHSYYFYRRKLKNVKSKD